MALQPQFGWSTSLSQSCYASKLAPCRLAIQCSSIQSSCLSKGCSDFFHNSLSLITETDVKRSCICQCLIDQSCGQYAALCTGAGQLESTLTVAEVLEQVDYVLNLLSWNALLQSLEPVQS